MFLNPLKYTLKLTTFYSGGHWVRHVTSPSQGTLTHTHKDKLTFMFLGCKSKMHESVGMTTVSPILQIWPLEEC